MSLLLTIDPETSDAKFTEADLKPGLKVIRKSDGAECVLCEHDDTSGGGPSDFPWSLFCSYKAVYNTARGVTNFHTGDMIRWLNADFRRADAKGGTITPLKHVKAGNWFMYDGNRYIKGDCKAYNHLVCWNVSGSCPSHITFDCLVRDLGPVRIDPRILEGE